MKKIMTYKNTGKMMLLSLVGFLVLLSSIFINPINHYLSGAILFGAGVLLYFLIVLFVAERNWLDIRAVFSGVWLVTIGMASLRLTEYQEQWIEKTWIMLAVAYIVFQTGATFGISLADIIFPISKKIRENFKESKLSFCLQEKRMFSISVGASLVGICCFAINIWIKGFVPAFSYSTTAYRDFYTKFHVFAVAATAVSGLCYYCIKTQALSRTKKILLWIFIFYHVILFPVLVVSRGVFIITALSLTTTIFYLNKRKLYVFIICLLAMAGIYLMTSNLRGYTDAMLNTLFEPSKIELKEDDGEEDGEITSFMLPPRIAFLYGYLTVSHDNFNEAVENTLGYTMGARQFYPFNVLLRIQAITDVVEGSEFYTVRPYLNTVNMIGIFYYDFQEWGVVICTLLWSILFGVLQGFYEKSRGPFSLFVLGYAMNPVALSFFASWIDSFDLWMLCGTIVIFAIIASIKINRSNENEEIENIDAA